MLKLVLLSLIFSGMACVTTPKESFPKAHHSVEPGSSVTLQGETVQLYNGSFTIGEKISEVAKGIDLPIEGKVSLISIVPSIDTRVCEEQTHILGESTNLDPKVARITVSRDLPMAQHRFANDAKLENVKFVSDYKTGSFGRSMGLMMQGKELLARGVIVTDKHGIIKYYQIVPDVAQLPDMEQAIKVANQLAKE